LAAAVFTIRIILADGAEAVLAGRDQVAAAAGACLSYELAAEIGAFGYGAVGIRVVNVGAPRL